MIGEVNFDLKLIAELELVKYLILHCAREVLVFVEVLASNVVEVDVSLQSHIHPENTQKQPHFFITRDTPLIERLQMTFIGVTARFQYPRNARFWHRLRHIA